MLYSLMKALLLPPVGLFFLILTGLLWWRHALLRRLALVAVLTLLLLSLPLVSQSLMRPLEPYPALVPGNKTQQDNAQAIVLLCAGRYTGAPEYGGDTIDSITLQRVRYAAWLQRHTGLPLIVSGGSPKDRHPPIGQLAARVLRQEFGVTVTAVEDRSRTTWENAALTAPMLQALKLERIYLVSSAWHLPRAVPEFERYGIQVIPAPTAFETRKSDDGLQIDDFYPHPHDLLRSYYALHEYLGHLWYVVRRYTG